MELNEILSRYKDAAFDTTQPFLREVYNLHVSNPNDSDLGKEVRKLLMNLDSYIREKSLEKNNSDLKEILNKQAQ